jgi:hypothetical protein
VPLESIRPDTNIIQELKADEDWEWKMIMLHIENVAGRKFPEGIQFTGCTVTELIEFAERAIDSGK